MADNNDLVDSISLSEKEKLGKSLIKLELVLEDIMSAFPKDDTGDPDFVGHRVYHKNEIEKEALNKKSRADVVKNVQTWAIIGILTVLASSLAQAFLVPFLQALKSVVSG